MVIAPVALASRDPDVRISKFCFLILATADKYFCLRTFVKASVDCASKLPPFVNNPESRTGWLYNQPVRHFLSISTK